MAARAPTTWNFWINEAALKSSRRIIETVPDDIYEDIEQTFQASQIILCDVFLVFSTTSTATVPWPNVARYHTYGTDYADAATPVNGTVRCYYRAWVASGGAGALQITGGASTLTDTFSNTTAAWIDGGTFTIAGDGAQYDLVVNARSTVASHAIYVDGILLVTEHL